MAHRFPRCDRQHLALALQDDLTVEQSTALADHLQRCPHCRSELELMAGAENWWQDARTYLSSSDELQAVDDGVAVRSREQNHGGPGLHPCNPSHPVRTTDGVAVRSREQNHGDDGGPGLHPCNPSRPDTSHPDTGHAAGDDADELPLDFLEASANPSSLGRLAGYEVEAVIGRGGMGVVLKAHQTELNRPVAVKVLVGHLAASAAARKRIAREARAAAAVVHDHVIPIHTVDTAGKTPYLVMPFIPGGSLQDRLDACGLLETKEVVRIALQTAQGLSAAHAQGLVHRDIKPANILLENGVERVRITDFGLARAVDDATQTQSGFIAGTPQYMAPEQARGSGIDARADLFSLGSVMYAMCTGHPPFRADTTLAVLRRICDDEPRDVREVNPDVPAWLAAIIHKLLSKSPADRFQTADEVVDLLQRWLAHLQQPMVCQPPPIVVSPKRGKYARDAKRGGAWLAIAAGASLLAAVLLLAATFVPGWLNHSPPNATGGEAVPNIVNRSSTAAAQSPAARTTSPNVETATAEAPRLAVDQIDAELQAAWTEIRAAEAGLQPASDAADASLASAIRDVDEQVGRLERDLRPPAPAADTISPPASLSLDSAPIP